MKKQADIRRLFSTKEARWQGNCTEKKLVNSFCFLALVSTVQECDARAPNP
jgi:hypothetical protein